MIDPMGGEVSRLLVQDLLQTRQKNITAGALSRREKYKNHKKVLYAILKENLDSIISAN